MAANNGDNNNRCANSWRIYYIVSLFRKFGERTTTPHAQAGAISQKRRDNSAFPSRAYPNLKGSFFLAIILLHFFFSARAFFWKKKSLRISRIINKVPPFFDKDIFCSSNWENWVGSENHYAKKSSLGDNFLTSN